MSNAQVQKYKYDTHKYTNTAYDEVPERASMWYIFLKEDCSGVSKMIFTCVERPNTKTQIHKYTNTQYSI